MIEVRNLSKSFKKQEIFQGVSFSLEGPGIYLIKGENGSGKTTLLSLLSGLDSSYSGSIAIDGRKLSKTFGNERVVSGISFAFQSPILFEKISVIENVFVPFGSEDRTRAKEVLEEVGLSEREDDDPSVLSEGEKARLGLARALFKQGDALFLDEVTANLDERTTRDIDAIIRREGKGKLVLFITHKPLDFQLLEEASTIEIKDRKVFVNRKRASEESNAATRSAHPKNKSFYLSKPWMAFCAFFSLLFLFFGNFFSVNFIEKEKMTVSPESRVEYIFENYPYIIGNSSPSAAEKGWFRMDFTQVESDDGAIPMAGLAYVSEENAQEIVPPVLFGRAPAFQIDRAEIIISETTFQQLRERYAITSEGEQALSAIQSRSFRNDYEPLEVVGVYRDYPDRYAQNIDAVEALERNGKRLTFEPENLKAMWRYGITSAFTVSTISGKPWHGSYAYLTRDEEGNIDRAMLQRWKDEIKEGRESLPNRFGELGAHSNVFLIDPDAQDPYDALDKIPLSLWLGYLFFALDALMAGVMAIAGYFRFRTPIVYFQAVNLSSSSLKKAFFWRASSWIATSFLSCALTGGTLTSIENALFDSSLLLASKFSFVSFSSTLVALISVAFLAQILGLILMVKFLFKKPSMKELKKG